MRIYNLKNVQISEKEAREFIKSHPELVDENKKKPFIEKGNKYWYLIPYGIDCSYWNNDSIDKERLARNNVFLTGEAAKKADKKRLAMGAIMQFIRDNDLEFEPDWEDSDQEKWQIIGWNYSYNEPIYNGYLQINKSVAHLPVFKSKEDRQLVFDNCSEKLKTLLT